MAAGDVYILAPATVTDTNHMDILPGSGAIVIHNITIPEGTAAELYHYDGTDSILVMSFNTSLFNLQLHADTTTRYRVKNVSGASKIMGADGMFTA